jgi:hypothetical protein
MKKTLLFLTFISFSFGFAQVLQSEDFNSLNVGNVGTDINGATPGQGGWLTFGGSNTDYQIVAETSGSSLRISGSSTATGTRFMWKDGLDLAWASRTSGNEIIEVEFNFNPSSNSTSLNGFRVYIYSNEATPKVLAGIGIAKNATVGGVPYQNVVQGFAYWTSTPGTGTYSFGLGPDANTPITLTANTWVRLGFSFNKTTGEIIWKGPGFNATFTGNATFPTVTNGIDPGELDFVITAGTGNTLAGLGFFDNLISRASATDTLLSIDSVGISDSSFAIYPNPTSNLLNISNNNNFDIKNISITDINGRVVKNQVGSLTQINVSDLNAGVYFITIEAAEGKTTKKFIKE